MLFIIVIIGLSRNCVHSYIFGRIITSKIITEIMHFNRLLWWLPWLRRLLIFGDVYNGQVMKNHSRSTTCFGTNAYMCYDYVHLDNLSDINANRTHLKPQHIAI